MIDWGLAALGLIILIAAGDALVKGAVNASLRLGIPALIVSLTVVAFGTSAPELLISVNAVIADAPGIALGNVVGSNIANILLVLGVPALLAGLQTELCGTRREYLLMIGVSVIFIGLCLVQPLTAWHGAVLLACLAVLLVDQFRRARRHLADDSATEDPHLTSANPRMPGWRIAALLVAGLAGLPLGADLLVDAGVRIATDFGISETVIGLTLVAVGTSLPELATTISAAYRRTPDVAIGNVLGSNVFNLAAILGIATLVGPIPVGPEFLTFDLWVMLGAAILVAPFAAFGWTMTRGVGALFTALYAAYLVLLLQ